MELGLQIAAAVALSIHLLFWGTRACVLVGAKCCKEETGQWTPLGEGRGRFMFYLVLVLEFLVNLFLWVMIFIGKVNEDECRMLGVSVLCLWFILIMAIGLYHGTPVGNDKSTYCMSMSKYLLLLVLLSGLYWVTGLVLFLVEYEDDALNNYVEYTSSCKFWVLRFYTNQIIVLATITFMIFLYTRVLYKYTNKLDPYKGVDKDEPRGRPPMFYTFVVWAGIAWRVVLEIITLVQFPPGYDYTPGKRTDDIRVWYYATLLGMCVELAFLGNPRHVEWDARSWWVEKNLRPSTLAFFSGQRNGARNNKHK